MPWRQKECGFAEHETAIDPKRFVFLCDFSFFVDVALFFWSVKPLKNQHEVGTIFGVTAVQRPARPVRPRAVESSNPCGSFGTQLDLTGHLCSSYVPSMEKMFLYAFILLIFLDWVFKPVISIYTSRERLVYQSFKSNFAALVDGLFYFPISKSEMMIPDYFHKFGTCTWVCLKIVYP